MSIPLTPNFFNIEKVNIQYSINYRLSYKILSRETEVSDTPKGETILEIPY